MMKLIDRRIHEFCNRLFLTYRKTGRRFERTYSTAYHHWLVYISRRSKDLSVKVTMLILTYCTFTVVRAISDLCYMSPTMERGRPYSEGIRQLDQFNELGKIPIQGPGYKIIRNKPTREYSKIILEFFGQRDK